MMEKNNPKGIFVSDDKYDMSYTKNKCPRCKTPSTAALDVKNVFVTILGKKYKCNKVNHVCLECHLLFDSLRYGVIVG